MPTRPSPCRLVVAAALSAASVTAASAAPPDAAPLQSAAIASAGATRGVPGPSRVPGVLSAESVTRTTYRVHPDRVAPLVKFLTTHGAESVRTRTTALPQHVTASVGEVMVARRISEGEAVWEKQTVTRYEPWTPSPGFGPYSRPELTVVAPAAVQHAVGAFVNEAVSRQPRFRAADRTAAVPRPSPAEHARVRQAAHPVVEAEGLAPKASTVVVVRLSDDAAASDGAFGTVRSTVVTRCEYWIHPSRVSGVYEFLSEHAVAGVDVFLPPASTWVERRETVGRAGTPEAREALLREARGGRRAADFAAHRRGPRRVAAGDRPVPHAGNLATRMPHRRPCLLVPVEFQGRRRLVGRAVAERRWACRPLGEFRHG